MNNLKLCSIFLLISMMAFWPAAVEALPPLELIVTSTQGTADYKRDTGTEWHSVEENLLLNPGDELRTGDESTVTLEIPGVSYLKVTSNTEMEIDNLARSTEERGLFTTQEITVNEIDLETKQGKVQNSVREREGVSTEYNLKTANAVAGVRGTSFQCEIDPFGRTECGVGEGVVEFRSRANPEAVVNIQAGQKSGIGPDATEPEEPEDLSEEEASELNEVEEESRSALLLPPAIESFELNGTSFEESIRIEYTEETELTLTGTATPQEDETEVVSVEASINGEAAEVSGLEDWSISGTPEVPEEGTESVETIEIRATDSNEKTATAQITATLVNPERTGDASGIPPENYEEGDVPVEVATVGGLPVDSLEFPYHTFSNDLASEGLLIEGMAEGGEASIEGVAYSMDGGQNWELASGGEQWWFQAPVEGGVEYNQIQVIAWSTDGTVGEPQELGTVIHSASNYTNEVRRVFEAMWDEFSRENTSGFLSYTDPDFYIRLTDGEENSRNELKRILDNDFFNEVSSLRIDYVIDQIFGSPTGGDIEVGRLEWKGLFNSDHGNIPFQSFPGGVYQFQRQANGEFKALSVEEFNVKIFAGADEAFIGDLDDNYGIFGIEPAEDNSGLVASSEPLDGQLILGSDCCEFSYANPTTPQFYVNNGSHGVCHGCTGHAVEDGGIVNLTQTRGQRNFEDVREIPEIDSGSYKSVTDVKQGDLYAVNVREFDDESQTYLIKVTAVLDSNSDSVKNLVRIRMVGVPIEEGGDEEVTEYGNVNPFQK